jgi:hypothetical protein
MTVEEAIRARVESLSAVTAIVGTRVWLDKLPQNPTFPAVLVRLVSDPRGQHLRGPDGLPVARVQVDAIAKEGSTDVYMVATELEQAIFGDGLGRTASGLFGWVGSIGSPGVEIRGITATARVPRYDPDELTQLVMSRDYFVRFKP